MNRKRLLAILLTLTMMTGMLPYTVFADETVADVNTEPEIRTEDTEEFFVPEADCFEMPEDEQFESDYLDEAVIDAAKEGTATQISLVPTNSEGMFKVVNAYIEKDGDLTELVFAMNADGYVDMIPGTYDEAFAAQVGDSHDNWIQGVKAFVNVYYWMDGSQTPVEEGIKEKWQFRMPVTLNETGTTQIPFVAVSKTRADEAERTDPANPDYSSAFIARQAIVDMDAKTIYTGNYVDEYVVQARSDIQSFPVEEEGLLYISGSPSANTYILRLTVNMAGTTYDRAFLGTAEEASTAGEIETISIGEDGSFVLGFYNKVNGKQHIVHGSAAAAFHVNEDAICAEAGQWVERTFAFDLLARTVTISGEELDPCRHEWDEGEVTKQPTCTEKGERTFTCRIDNSHKKTEEIAALGHTPKTAVKENVVAATCTAGGSYDSVVYCSVCEEELSRTAKTTKKLGHSMKETAAKAATTTSEGNIQYWYCSRCKKYFSDANGKNTIKKSDTVILKLQSLTVSASNSKVAVGKTAALTTKGAKGTVTYKSSDTKIATVDKSTGKVKAYKVGTVKITATAAATSAYQKGTKTITIKVVPAATASFKAENVSSGVKLTWKKVAGATKYYIQRDGADLRTIKSGDTTSYTDKPATVNGKKYKYTITAYASTGKSTVSKSVTTCYLTRPTMASVTSTKAGKLTAAWKKNAKADGYKIQYSTSSSFASGNKTVPVSGAASLSKTISDLSSGKTYYVRVRAFKTVNNVVYYSAWSAKKSVKVK